MPRPKKSRDEKQYHTISVRLTDDEIQALDRRRGATSRGGFLRRNFLGTKEPPPIPEPNRELFATTSRWASNLNQIAGKLNCNEAVEIQQIKKMLAEFRRSLIGLMNDDRENHKGNEL